MPKDQSSGPANPEAQPVPNQNQTIPANRANQPVPTPGQLTVPQGCHCQYCELELPGNTTFWSEIKSFIPHMENSNNMQWH